MPQIAIIDDNMDQSGTLKKTLDHYLRKFGSNLTVITQFPFQDIEEYFEFIDQNQVCVLILDERLNDQSGPNTGPVNYKGNQLVTELRERLKDFPIFMVTTYAPDDDLLAKFNQFEYILTRQEITEDEEGGQKYVPIIARSGHRYLDSNNKELSEFNELTKLVAAGNKEPEIVSRLKALQVKLELPTTGFNDRKVWLDEYQSHIENLEALKNELWKKLQGT
jgi:CheY-like chemotaxis protein